MKLVLESTEVIYDLGAGQLARLWTGYTSGGIAVQCMVMGIAVKRDADQRPFERELIETGNITGPDRRAFG